MKIYIGTDHAGFEMKESLKTYLTELGHVVEDKGATELNKEDDYPDFIGPVAAAIEVDPTSRGIVLGYSGQGEAMVANRLRGVRCAVYYGGTTEVVKLSREHNDANVLSLGAHFISLEEAKKVVKLWLETNYSEDERHIRRLAKF